MRAGMSQPLVSAARPCVFCSVVVSKPAKRHPAPGSASARGAQEERPSDYQTEGSFLISIVSQAVTRWAVPWLHGQWQARGTREQFAPQECPSIPSIMVPHAA
jgi:hypothetical protein